MWCVLIRARVSTWVVQSPERVTTVSLIEQLQKRAALLTQIRSFFMERGVLEVEVPLISRCATTDLHIESIPALVEQNGQCQERYLITSPEFYMKRMLAQGAPAIFYLGKVFRQGDHGRRHHHEFTMLEWYRPQWNEQQLMDEIRELLTLFFPQTPYRRVSYGELFVSQFGIDPHEASHEELIQCVGQHIDIKLDELSHSDCLDLLFSHCIEPGLSGITFVVQYPVQMAALAKTGINLRQQPVARRFEVFLDDMELANGYAELTDPQEQAARFDRDLLLRRQQNKKMYPPDFHLLQSLRTGLPECAGVALGLDRLQMKIQGAASLEELIPFLGDQ